MTAVALLVIVLLFATAHVVAERAPARIGWLPLAALDVLLLLLSLELLRYDHGQPRLVQALCMIGAPIVAIFAGSLWATRRLYGWPDLGRWPGRAALAALAVLVGVLVGARVREGDVERSRTLAEGIARRVAERHREGRPPASLADLGDVPCSAMGAVCPPPFTYEPSDGGGTISFPISADRELALDVATHTWMHRAR